MCDTRVVSRRGPPRCVAGRARRRRVVDDARRRRDEARRYKVEGATLDNLRKAVTTLEDTERTARRIFGGAHPLTEGIEAALRNARAALRAREETQP